MADDRRKRDRDREEDEDEDRPRRRRPSRDVEDEDEDRPRRRRSRDVEPAATPVVPMVYGILSILLSCIPIVGGALGGFAISRANAALDELPGGKRGRAARKNMGLAKVLGTVGMCLSLVVLIIALILKIRS
jgi:hypothetical protein